MKCTYLMTSWKVTSSPLCNRSSSQHIYLNKSLSLCVSHSRRPFSSRRINFTCVTKLLSVLNPKSKYKYEYKTSSQHFILKLHSAISTRISELQIHVNNWVHFNVCDHNLLLLLLTKNILNYTYLLNWYNPFLMHIYYVPSILEISYVSIRQ